TIRMNYSQMNGYLKELLFYLIPIFNWVCDELHVLLRITNQLWELILSDLSQEQVDETIWQSKILNEMKRLNITYQFWHKNNNFLYTSLMGSDKLKVLQNFNLIAIFQFNSWATQIQNLWNQFYELYSLMQDNKTTGRVFYEKAQNWLMSFLVLFQDQSNKSNFLRFLAWQLKKKYLQVCWYFQNTLKDGDHENLRKLAILKILEHENRQLYFTSNDTLNYFKKSKKYRLESK
ncbi:35134_t:CDS:2, partial [Gigaspora margarita]